MVKYIVFVVLLILFIYNNFVYCIPPKCLSKPGSGVSDSWYIFDLSEEEGSIFWDSASPGNFENIKLQLRINPKSPLILTFDQIKNKEFNHVTYNDQPSGIDNNFRYSTKASRPDGGHTKGFFIWNNDGGIHVMTSLPNFPQYELNGVGGVIWKNGIYSIRQTMIKNNPYGSNEIIKNRQHAQYVYCYPLSSVQIKEGFIYRHLVLTNSIIGVANNFEIRNSLSFFQDPENAKKIIGNFPKLNFKKPTAEINNDNYEFYNEKHTLDEISKYIMKGIDSSDKFPLYLLSSHAYHFIVRSKFRHISSFKDGESTDRIYFYQRDKYYPYLKYMVNGEIQVVHANNFDKDVNIWEYASNFPNENDQTIIGPIYLQTQQYDDIKKNYDNSNSKGLVPPLINSNIYQVNRMKFGGNQVILTREMDHSKQAFSVPSSNNVIKKDWFCVGDNNFMDLQSTRGGSVYCFINSDLSSYFASKVESFKYLNKQDKIVNVSLIGIIKNYIIGLFSQALSVEVIKKPLILKKILPIQPESELWVAHDTKKYKFSESSVEIVNGEVSFPLINYFCLPSFYFKNWDRKTIICLEENKKGACLPENSKFLCTQKNKVSITMITTLESIESDQILQIKENEGSLFGGSEIMNFNYGTPDDFFRFVQVSYITDKINQKMYASNPEVFDKNEDSPVMVSYKPGETLTTIYQYDFEKYCKTIKKNTRILYGTCLDFYFSCFDQHDKNIDIFHEIISEIIGIDYENPFILPDEYRKIQCGFYFHGPLTLQLGIDKAFVGKSKQTKKKRTQNRKKTQK